jgi:hypothetical protein
MCRLRRRTSLGGRAHRRRRYRARLAGRIAPRPRKAVGPCSSAVVPPEGSPLTAGQSDVPRWRSAELLATARCSLDGRRCLFVPLRRCPQRPRWCLAGSALLPSTSTLLHRKAGTAPFSARATASLGRHCSLHGPRYGSWAGAAPPRCRRRHPGGRHCSLAGAPRHPAGRHRSLPAPHCPLGARQRSLEPRRCFVSARPCFVQCPRWFPAASTPCPSMRALRPGRVRATACTARAAPSAGRQWPLRRRRGSVVVASELFLTPALLTEGTAPEARGVGATLCDARAVPPDAGAAPAMDRAAAPQPGSVSSKDLRAPSNGRRALLNRRRGPLKGHRGPMGECAAPLQLRLARTDTPGTSFSDHRPLLI